MLKFLLRLWIFIPLLGSITTVMATAPAMDTLSQTERNAETTNQIINLAVGGILTVVLTILQRNQSRRERDTQQQIKKVETSTVPRAEHDNLLHEVAELKTEISTLVTLKQVVSILQEMSQTAKAQQATAQAHQELLAEFRKEQAARTDGLGAQIGAVAEQANAHHSDTTNLLDEMRKEVSAIRSSMDRIPGAHAEIFKRLDIVLGTVEMLRKSRTTSEMAAVVNNPPSAPLLPPSTPNGLSPIAP